MTSWRHDKYSLTRTSDSRVYLYSSVYSTSNAKAKAEGWFDFGFGPPTCHILLVSSHKISIKTISPMNQITKTNNMIEPIPMFSSIASLPINQSQILFPPLNNTFVGFAGPSRSRPRRRLISEQEKFFLLIKMILRYLERSYHFELHYAAKQILQRCIHSNRQGEHRSLKMAIETRLKALLGVEFYTHMQRYLDAHCESTSFGYSFITRKNVHPVTYV